MSAPSTETAPTGTKQATSGEQPVPHRRGFATGELIQRFGLIGLWLVVVVIYGAIEPDHFLRVSTLQTVFDSQTTLLFLAAALLCTVIVGEFVDLSIAANLGLSATLLPILAVNHGWNVWGAAAMAVVSSTLVGTINGLLVVACRINTIVVTLGMSSLLLGIALWISDLTLVTGLDDSIAKIAITEFLGLPVTFWYGAVVMALFAYVLSYTPLGTHLRFVGSNHEVARLAGVRVQRIRFGAFVAAGAFCGVGGVLSSAALGGFDPNTSQTYLMPVFAATYLGTAVILPGRFNPIGAWIGVYFLATGILGLQLLGGTGWVANVFYGGVLIIAVAASTYLGRRRAA